MKFKLHANCKIVKGASRATICDLQRNSYVFIPLELTEIIINGIIDCDQLKNELSHEDYQTLEQYLDFLEDNDLIFHCPDELIENFTDLSEEWDYPAKISNAIIEISPENISQLIERNIFSQLNQLGCLNIEIRIFPSGASKLFYLSILRQLIKFEFFSIDIGVELKELLPDETIKSVVQLVNKVKTIKTLFLYNPIKNKEILSKNYGFGGVAYLKGSLNKQHCGMVHHSFFDINPQVFSESQNFNTCLNRKISIDKNGEIRNCPSMSDSYGNIRMQKLNHVLEQQKFTEKWKIKKDEIQVCKDCEFRHICIDCRAFLEDPSNKKSKPLKCGYNPYTTEWEEWSKNPLKTNTLINYYAAF